MILLASPRGFIDTDCDDLSRLHVDGNGLSLAELHALAEADPTVAVADDDHLWVELRRLAACAASAGGPDGAARFEGVITYATSRGWVSGDGRMVRAHVENLRR